MCYKYSEPRENELREPIPHIGLCTNHEPRSSIFKRNVMGQNFLKFSRMSIDSDTQNYLVPLWNEPRGGW